MENGKQSFDQRSDSTKTIEDRDYFTLGPNIFNRSDYKYLLKRLGHSQETIDKRITWPAKVDPYWIDQLKDGWEQFQIRIDRERHVKEILKYARLNLYYNSSSPYCWWFESHDTMVVITLAKDKVHAEQHANKILTQQYLNTNWLAMKERDTNCVYPDDPFKTY